MCVGTCSNIYCKMQGFFKEKNMYLKKTIILSAVDGEAQKAVLNIEKFKSLVEGQLKLYNFKSEPQGVLTLGFLQDGKVIKAGLHKQQENKYTFVIEDDNSDLLEDEKSIACALVNTKEGQSKPLLFGSSDGRLPLSSELRLASGITLFDEPLTVQNVTNFLDEQQIDYEPDLKQEIQHTIDAEIQCNKCVDCKYRQAFYTTNSLETEPEPDQNEFYDDVKSQLNELFEKYPEEDFLKDIIPNSKWVKIDLEDGKYYVVGLVYDDGTLKYICYGLPGVADQMPEEMSQHAQWLPIVPEENDGFGYWLSYQDASSGEQVSVSII